MVNVQQFTFNAFQENTFVIWDETKSCIIFDPGCATVMEQNQLSNFILQNGLSVTKLINTHCHIDHVLGNKFVSSTYGVALEAHKDEKPVLDACPMVSQMYGIPYTEISPDITVFLDEGDTVSFGNSSLEIFFTPGHSPASLSFYNEESKILIAGDVLFDGSIGRTDLPGGDHDTLIDMIKTKLMALPDDVRVYCGHGNSTTIGKERRTNPFLNNI